MQKHIKESLTHFMNEVKLPSYDDIPEMGLYLEQTVRFISEYLDPMPGISITASMVGNYVKKGIIESPVRKMYSRDQIAYLIFIAFAKTVLSLEDIQLLIRIQRVSYESKTAYEYLVREMMNVLSYVFGFTDELRAVGVENSQEKTLLRNTIITVAHKIYLDKCFESIHEYQTVKAKEHSDE